MQSDSDQKVLFVYVKQLTVSLFIRSELSKPARTCSLPETDLISSRKKGFVFCFFCSLVLSCLLVITPVLSRADCF